MKKIYTERGFSLYKFDDAYGAGCSLQKSSNIIPHVWLGIDDADPQIMAKDTPEGGVGWVKYPIPENVLLTTRMHLNKSQCKDLIKLLQEFVDTEEI